MLPLQQGALLFNSDKYEKLSRAKFSTIENSGHEVNINNPKGLAKAMEALNVV